MNIVKRKNLETCPHHPASITHQAFVAHLAFILLLKREAVYQCFYSVAGYLFVLSVFPAKNEVRAVLSAVHLEEDRSWLLSSFSHSLKSTESCK